MAETWKANKANIPEAQQFDWTYSTPYRGCTTKAGAKWDPEETDEKIDFESLKVCYPLVSHLTVLVFIFKVPHNTHTPFLSSFSPPSPSDRFVHFLLRLWYVFLCCLAGTRG